MDHHVFVYFRVEYGWTAISILRVLLDSQPQSTFEIYRWNCLIPAQILFLLSFCSSKSRLLREHIRQPIVEFNGFNKRTGTQISTHPRYLPNTTSYRNWTNIPRYRKMAVDGGVKECDNHHNRWLSKIISRTMGFADAATANPTTRGNGAVNWKGPIWWQEYTSI